MRSSSPLNWFWWIVPTRRSSSACAGQDDRRRRDLVDVADLQADDAVLDVVDDADAVATADLGGALEQLDDPQPLAVERHRHAALEARRSTTSGSSGRQLGPRDELEDVVVGRVVEVLDPAALRRASPEVVVDRVRRVLGAALDRDAVLARVGDLLLAPHLPAAHGRDDLQLGRERRHGRLDAHLVVALAGAAVGDRVAAVLARVVDGELGDQRPPEGGEQRVAEAVDRVGLDGRHDEVAGELLARVDHLGRDGAELQRLALDDVVVLAGLAEVDGQRDDLGVVLVLDPLEHHARVQAAGVQQQDAVDLAGLGEVGGGAGVGRAVRSAMRAGRLPPPTQRQHAREPAMTVSVDPRCMDDRAFLPDPDNAVEAKIAVRKAGRQRTSTPAVCRPPR